jgi:hypothetical protein
MGIGRPLTPTALMCCCCLRVLLLFSCRNAGICSSLYGVSTADGFIYGDYYFYRVICVELQINADDLLPKTAGIEQRLMFLLLFLVHITLECTHFYSLLNTTLFIFYRTRIDRA